VAPSTLFDASLFKLSKSRHARLSFFRSGDGLWINVHNPLTVSGPSLAPRAVWCTDTGRTRGVWRMSEDRSSKAWPGPAPVAFGRRLAASDVFKAMFREGMALVEETATYLDGEGRRESHRLSRSTSLAYATESMRLTTRLMQLASWLLLQRAVNEGDLSVDQASQERAKVKLGGLSTAIGGATWDDLPGNLRLLIERSLRLQERVVRLDEALRSPPAPDASENQVRRAQSRIAGAFGGGLK
jgi:regulator of CtrA degradation